MDLSEKKLVFVTGKGGVGKSAVAASIAYKMSTEGKSVCLIELGNQSFYESFFELRGIGYDPIELQSNLQVALLTPEDCLKEYVVHFIKLPKLYEILFNNRVSRAFLNAAPALAEIAILGKLTSDIRGVIPSGYDAYVVDCYSSGYAMALFRAPKGLSDAFRTGPIFDQSKGIEHVLKDPKTTHFVVVTMPEEMPTQETCELLAQLKNELGASPDVVCTKIVDPPIGRDSLKNLIGRQKDGQFKKFAEFIRARTEKQAAQLEKLRVFAPEFYGVPNLVNRLSGQECMEETSKCLDRPWKSANL